MPLMRKLSEYRERQILEHADPALADGEQVTHWVRVKDPNKRGGGILFLTDSMTLIAGWILYAAVYFALARADAGVVTEPHSFDVKVTATEGGRRHSWSYASYEGRTTIARAAAFSLDEAAGASFGRASVLLHPDAISAIGRTAASRRYDEYGFIGGAKGAEGARGAKGVTDRTSAPEWERKPAPGDGGTIEGAARLTVVLVPRP